MSCLYSIRRAVILPPIITFVACFHHFPAVGAMIWPRTVRLREIHGRRAERLWRVFMPKFADHRPGILPLLLRKVMHEEMAAGGMA
ncbi:MAG: hypothetical protein DME22_25010 [Verrucomicrobia bacterium]|nr:MAG: hypothetical protein DME22_25010 [Verrucomicrobiota bacterium]